MKRLFLAVKINPFERFLETYYTLKRSLKNDEIKWVEPEIIHLTLKFFGETEDERITHINYAVENALKEVNSFEMHIEKCGIFGSSYKPRVVWFGLRESDELLSLYHYLKEELETIGFEYDRQNFVPHLTIGRIKHIKDKKYFQKLIEPYKDVKIQKEMIHKVVLYESILHSRGPEYKIVKEFSL
jgi:2'-5' RNA ligase